MTRVPLSDGSVFQDLRELRMMLQLATDGERACRCALRSPSVESFLLDASAAVATSK
jgi:hypothetical protein